MSAAEVTALETARTRLTTIYNDLLANPKPTYTVDGRTYQWESYLKTIGEQLDYINARIGAVEGPFELVSFAE